MKIKSLLVLMPLCAAIFATEPQRRNSDIDAELNKLRAIKNELSNAGQARLACLEYQKANRELSMVCQLALERITTSGIPEYGIKEWIKQQKSSQIAWIKFREEDSKVVEYVHWGGSGAGMFRQEWKTQLTQTRIQQLKDRYYISEVEISQTSEQDKD
jgi:uncharacterized protein YecT (DUF1311 family)